MTTVCDRKHDLRNVLELQRLSVEAPRVCVQACWAPGGPMHSVLAMVDRAADSDVPVLLSGESGVGKEVVARELHRRSSRRSKLFLKVNCAAMPADLLESELFGHERGAFTGAGGTRLGKFEFAQEGTILLDEITEMPLSLQAKLLHVLQDRQITRLGGNRAIDVNARVLAATNRVPEEMIRRGAFREDLYYRLQVIEIRIAPLRERQQEITPLAEFFLAKFAELYRRPRLRPSPSLMQALMSHDWPGNIRELENMIKRLVVLQDETFVLSELSRLRSLPRPRFAEALASPPVDAASSMPESTPAGQPETGSEDLSACIKAAALRVEREAIDKALARFQWNRRKAAVYLKVSYKTLLTKMRECGLSGPNAA